MTDDAELFAGNSRMVMAAVDRKISPRQLLRSWAIVYLGNLVGVAGLALAFGCSRVIRWAMSRWRSHRQRLLWTRPTQCPLKGSAREDHGTRQFTLIGQRL